MPKLPKTIQKARKKPGGSNAGKYPNVKRGDFAGKAGGAPATTYPINTLTRAKSAIKLSHNAPKPAALRAFVFKKYPGLVENSEFSKSGRKKRK